MRIEYDSEADSLYIHIQKKKVFKTKEIEEGVNIDIDEKGKIIGFEIVGVSERYNLKDIFNISTVNLYLKKIA